jgi:sulfur-oxidizing protein SoxZ
MTSALVKAPTRARRGEVIEITAMVAHPMETGFRSGENGQILPRNIVQSFVCRYDGVEVFRAEFFPAITANPYIAFSTIATRSGTLEFRWIDDRGAEVLERAAIIVE